MRTECKETPYWLSQHFCTIILAIWINVNEVENNLEQIYSKNESFSEF